MPTSPDDLTLIDAPDLIELTNPAADPSRPDHLRRFDVSQPAPTALRFSADVCTQGVTGPPGQACMIFFNVEYRQGPIYWDTFLYPDTGSTPWRRLACEIKPRGDINAIELHIRFHARGTLRVRHLRVDAIPPWPDDAQAVVAIFGDSTDMTSYLPQEFRVARRLELLLRDRFPDHRVDVHCFAEGGEFIQRLLDTGRLTRELATLSRCDVAMVRYGINDRGHQIDPAAFGRQLHTVCDTILARFPAARIVLSTTLPRLTEPYDAQTRAVAAARGFTLIPLDQHIRQRSAAGDGDWHIGPGHDIGRRRQANPADNPDGLLGNIHPNAYGCQMIAERYFESVEPLVRQALDAR